MWNSFGFPLPYFGWYAVNYHSNTLINQQIQWYSMQGPTDSNNVDKPSLAIQKSEGSIDGQRNTLRQVRQKSEERRCLDRLRKKKRKQREDDYMRKAQKKDRNLPSNILKNFINYLFTKCSLIQSIGKVLRQEEKIYFLSLVQKLRQVKQIKVNYVPESAISKLWLCDLLSLGQKIVLRKILKDYLKNVYPLIMICSVRFKKMQKLAYLKTARSLCDGFFGREEEEE